MSNINPNTFSKSKCICGKIAPKKCSRCKVQRYCSKECQRDDWNEHKKICSANLKLKNQDLGYYLEKGVKSNKDITPNYNIITNADIMKYEAIAIGKSYLKTKIYNMIKCNMNDECKEKIKKHVLKHWDAFTISLLMIVYRHTNTPKFTGLLTHVKSNVENTIYYFVFHIESEHPKDLYMLCSIDKPVKSHSIESEDHYIFSSFDILINYSQYQKKDGTYRPSVICKAPKYFEYIELDWETGDKLND